MANANKKLNLFFSKNIYLGSFSDVLKMPNANLIECCFIGRSNVGKSSIINSITKNKKLAKTSKTPGRTQTINLFEINKTINIIDLPGYGYAKISKNKREQLNDLIQSYISLRINLIMIFILIDCKIGIKNSDIDFINYINSINKNFSIILTKIDKCSIKFVKNQIFSINSFLKQNNEKLTEIIISSSKKNKGILDIQKNIFNLSKNNEI